MYDLYSDPDSLALIQAFAGAKKPIAAVCHGPSVLLKATTPTGDALLSSATATGFSNTEEEQVGMTAVMPYLLEDELNRVTKGKYVKADQPWGEKVVVSQCAAPGVTLITGQNPTSAKGVAKEILNAVGL